MYAKSPIEEFFTINLKEILDVNIEQDPKHYTDLQALSSKESFNNLN